MEEIKKTPDTENEYLLEVKNLVKWFPIKSSFFKQTIGNVRAVDGISFKIKRGQTMGLVGESGCGKSTAGRTILRLLEKTSGEVWFDGKEIFSLSKEELRRMVPELRTLGIQVHAEVLRSGEVLLFDYREKDRLNHNAKLTVLGRIEA